MKKKLIIGLVMASTLAVSLITATSLKNGIVSKASKIESTKTTNKDASTLDLAFKDNQEEEKYIVNLVSEKTNQKLTTADWEICLKYLEDNYDELIADKSIDKEKVKSYVSGYLYVKKMNSTKQATGKDDSQETFSKRTNQVATGTNAAIVNNTYDVSKVTDYIDKYWENYNPDFPAYDDYGGDCANFVSQCLYAGGMKMVGTNTSNFNNWFCRTKNTEQVSKVSSTWRGAEAFSYYWKNNCLECKDFDASYFEDRKAFNAIYRFANVGDAVSMLNDNGRPYHTLIVSEKNKNGDRDIRLAAHTGPQRERSLYEYVNDYWVSKVRIYRMSTPSAELEASYDYDMKNTPVEVVDSADTEEDLDYEDDLDY